jgi:hypothetical protein
LFFANYAFAYNDGFDRRIVMVNASSYTINEIHASNVGRQYYGPDLMGSQVLYSGEKGVLNLDDETGSCRFDFKIVTEAGIIFKRNVNICQVEVYTIYD